VPFRLKPGPDDNPVQLWSVHVLKGRLDIRTKRNRWGMEAPPGAAYFHGDMVSGPDEAGPQRRKRLPAWADPKAPQPEEAKLIKGVVDKYRERLKNTEASEAFAELLSSAAKDKNKKRASMTRQLVIFAAAAVDDVDRVVDALSDTTHADMRKTAVVSLRHWIGIDQEHNQKLYQVLLAKGYTKGASQTIMQLLHSPFDPEQPETYETLIAYLQHGDLAVRVLAYWHLSRLAQAGRNIPYDPAGSAADRAAAVKEWKKLIPSGELPPAPKEEKK
jgi:hypothetical protein